MNKETLEKANFLMKKINDINWVLGWLDEPDGLILCNQFESGNYRTLLTLDDDMREFIKIKLNIKKQKLKKELEEL